MLFRRQSLFYVSQFFMLNGPPAEAQAELEWKRAAQRASYARRKERTLNGPPAKAQAELEQQQAAQRASYIRQKETMLNDPEYREQVLQSRKIGRDKKRQAIEDDPLHVDARKDEKAVSECHFQKCTISKEAG